MKISNANIKLQKGLSELYDERESKQIAAIFWEDLFGYRNGIDRHLHTQEIETFESALKKLEQGMPIQYVTGISDFYNLRLMVNEKVLIPRPETEELVYEILNAKVAVGASVLDIGTGSGCIPVALKSKRVDFKMTAIDLSEGALKVAKRNAEKYELGIDFKCLDFLDRAAWQVLEKYDLIVSNPPYIPVSEKDRMSASTLAYEPEMALFPESDDEFIFYRQIAEFGKTHMNESGSIFLECNEFNAAGVKEIFEHSGYSQVNLLKDMQGKDRMLKACS
ncbi:peptide chain release factor N(5)-glutamine methyltransferase [Portibacter lacus]|uniref:peptide chain release factor N(5)-glutamine methyltransferase n=1 Tax=Portibacter lacus TaxID=1099794 RepID=A0AA37SR80_9BACT|nr:peptide chain release factor N(5)-glutamine methyltransferase [Portibacter lacus]GLR18289.1 release factor glutamine methyltransferase [Portibacter lacus]